MRVNVVDGMIKLPTYFFSIDVYCMGALTFFFFLPAA